MMWSSVLAMHIAVHYFLMEILWHVELRENSLPEIIFIQQRQTEWLEGIFPWRLPGRTLWNVLKKECEQWQTGNQVRSS